MRKNSVVIKSCAYGLMILLDPDLDFTQLLDDVAAKFREAARFFRNAQMAISFRGRNLTDQEELELIRTITDNARIEIVCLVDESKESSDHYKEAVIKSLELDKDDSAVICPGALLSGQKLEAQKTALILGDVKPGASVISDGSIIVLGRCLGQVWAGYSGRQDVFIAALVLKPSMISISGHAARPAITKRSDPGEYDVEPKIAYLEDGHLKLYDLDGTSFDKMKKSFAGNPSGDGNSAQGEEETVSYDQTI